MLSLCFQRYVRATLLSFIVWLGLGLYAQALAQSMTLFASMPLKTANDVVALRDSINTNEARHDQIGARTLLRAAHAAQQWELIDEQAMFLGHLLRFSYDRSAADVKLDFDSLRQATIALTPQTTQRRRSWLHNLLGISFSSDGQRSQQVIHHRMAVEHATEHNPIDHHHAIGNLAASYMEIGDSVRAARMLRQSVENVKTLPNQDFLHEYSNVYDYTWLSSIMRGYGKLDSAVFYAELAEHNLRAIQGSARYRETVHLLLEELAYLAIDRGNFSHAEQLLDSLSGIGGTGYVLCQAHFFAKTGRAAEALERLDNYTEVEPELKAMFLTKALDYGLASGQSRRALHYAQLLVEHHRATLAQTNLGLVAATETQLESFEAQLAADRMRHAQELALLRERERTYLSVLLMALCLAGAVYSWRRYRKSHQRTATLSTMVSERDRDLDVANKQLASRVASLEQFNHLLSHDLREPVRSISGFTTLLKRKLHGQAEVAETLSYLHDSIEQLKHLLNGLEALRRVEEHKDRSRCASAIAVCREVVDGVQQKYPRFECRLISTCEVEHLVPTRMTKAVLQELLQNAALFGGVNDAVCELQTAYCAQSHSCVFTVTDYGIGMEPTYHTQIFDPFKRLNRREEYPGAGIGLALARTAAEQAGGSLRLVKSAPGQGSTFELRIQVVGRTDIVKPHESSAVA